ncbi:MAG TPA: hypothetical protein VN726_02945 [Hanamia sp.]|nr:hypothetical protein [Hanamia sp.]
MAEKERITNPSMGSNELGSETSHEAPMGVSAGSDTQLHIAALAGKKHKKSEENVNDDELVIDNDDIGEGFPEADETDE